jgi:glycosyltransferase involved in cell wall biosynthesis
VSDPAVVDIIVGGTQGLRRDAEIASAALATGFTSFVHVSRQRNLHLPHRRLWRRALRRLANRRSISVFFENVPSGWLAVSPCNFLVPNQEFMRPETVANVGQCAQVWCKTRYAERLFGERGFGVRYIGFSSRDTFRASVQRDATSFLHVPGRSHLKGTRTILALWQRHPEWPQLVVVTRNDEFRRHEARNVRMVTTALEQHAMDVLMNERGIHLCPSETEGFGHYIAEALACRALVITVDAPPMNELVRPEFGLLAAPARFEPMGFGSRFFVDVDALEQQVLHALAMSREERELRGALARDAYLAGRADFLARFRATVGEAVA